MNVIISGNTSSQDGGGIYSSNGILDITNTNISNNTATSGGGGGICSIGGRLNLDNVQITDNSTLNSGGGIFAQTVLNSTFSNITVSNNSALVSGGSIYFCCDSDVEIINSTFSNNSPQEIAFSDDAMGDSISVSYSNLDGGLESVVFFAGDTIYWGDGNIDVDPCLWTQLMPIINFWPHPSSSTPATRILQTVMAQLPTWAPIHI